MDSYAVVEMWDMFIVYIPKKEHASVAEQFVNILDENNISGDIIAELREHSPEIDSMYQDIDNDEDYNEEADE